MKLLFSIIALIASILSIILAILPMEKIALIPAIIAFVFGLVAFFMSKNESKKLIKFVFFIISASLLHQPFIPITSGWFLSPIIIIFDLLDEPFLRSYESF